MPRGIPNYSRDQAAKDVETASANITKLRKIIAEAYEQMAEEAKTLTKALAKLSGFGI